MGINVDGTKAQLLASDSCCYFSLQTVRVSRVKSNLPRRSFKTKIVLSSLEERKSSAKGFVCFLVASKQAIHLTLVHALFRLDVVHFVRQRVAVDRTVVDRNFAPLVIN